MADKQKTVRDDMPAKRIFESIEAATNAIVADLSTYSDIGELPIVSPMDSARGVDRKSVV